MIGSIARGIFSSDYPDINYTAIDADIVELKTSLEGPCTVPIYHYTNIVGLTGIIGSRKIWATSAFHTNDGREFYHAFDVFGTALSKYRTSISACNFCDFVDNFFERVEPTTHYYPFIACFSEARDQLSQWRAYTETTGRVSIGFPGQYLSALAIVANNEANKLPSGHHEHWGFYFSKVIYDDTTKAKILTSIFQSLHQFIEINKFDLNDSNIFNLLVGLIKAILAHLAVTFKDRTFSEEREWRLVCIHENVTSKISDIAGSRIHFRSGPYGLTPYIEVGLRSLNPYDDTLPLTELLFGPDKYPTQTIMAAKLFRRELDLDANITQSASPLR